MSDLQKKHGKKSAEILNISGMEKEGI